jgi:hypothetical protein
MDLNNITGIKKEVWMEKARTYAESRMPQNWNREDGMSISIFYNHMLYFISQNYNLTPKK